MLLSFLLVFDFFFIFLFNLFLFQFYFLVTFTFNLTSLFLTHFSDVYIVFSNLYFGFGFSIN